MAAEPGAGGASNGLRGGCTVHWRTGKAANAVDASIATAMMATAAITKTDAEVLWRAMIHRTGTEDRMLRLLGSSADLPLLSQMA
mmetsp:Transcript_3155/g.3682  ORF Transcript_3155/g.3682 Transcript_3155/m.3682 type:complete len:85 (-) Transcript_3155:43-297(-)